MPNSGQTLAERYRLATRIAVGGMGEVWQAVDVRLDRTVAVKVLKPELCGDAEFLHRFRTEARTTASLNHPGIAAVHDYGETAAVPDGPEDTAYLVMEHVEGEPLAAILAREGRITAEHTLEMLEQAGNALHAAHERGLVHRDVKPGNILVTPNGTIKLTDFGIAKAADAAPVTRSGMVMGTAHYISPEQALGGEAIPASDVYSLAVVGYECLRGHRPFLSDNAVTVAMMHIRDLAQPLPPDVPPGARALIEATLVKDPRRRYSDGGEFANAVASVRAGRPLPTPVALTVPQQPPPGAPPHTVTQAPARGQHPGPGAHPTGQQPPVPPQPQSPPPQHPPTGNQPPLAGQQHAAPATHSGGQPPGPPTGAPLATGAHQRGNTVPPGVIPPQSAPPPGTVGGGTNAPGYPTARRVTGRWTALWVVLGVVVVLVLIASGFALLRMYDRAAPSETYVPATVTPRELTRSAQPNTSGRVRLADFASPGAFNEDSVRHPEGRLSSVPRPVAESAIGSPGTDAPRQRGLSPRTEGAEVIPPSPDGTREAGKHEVGGTAHRARNRSATAVAELRDDLMGRSWTQIGTTQR
ncbi:serine/threonine protein kinase [Actinopolyspora erythraea]|uniref:non-specific serine/threonine protein kinase n=1 Tax=Actinopolyspora erythraea TaxID=414996 RepID=A0A099DB83_9ACTN|nr:serine/threonine-protein kinase [Actinopolyspora erythraea]ASU77006.1 serine/threonine protein kinase [Actinopolyspora erythraea]KGI82997.1 serine/threonine protein kinase [Actinopolyspora erythraea]